MLWFGSNPHIKRSLAMIVSRTRGCGDFPDFESQCRSGLFGSARWEGTNPTSDFSPLQHPERRWTVYQEVLRKVFGSTDACAMANCVPWGSASINDFVRTLSEVDPKLLRRAVAFAEGLTERIISSLKPRLLLVPFSLGNNRCLDAIQRLGVSMSRFSDCRMVAVETERPQFVCTSAHIAEMGLLYRRSMFHIRLRSDCLRWRHDD